VGAWDAQTAALNLACLTAFGRDVIYLPEAGGQFGLRAIFQPVREAEDASPGVYAVLFVRLADLQATPVRGDEVKIGGVLYKIFAIEADTSGAAVLRMRQV
jgi:hypothetical protein